MGLLDDAIREHLDLKRRLGGDPAEIERLEREALGPVRREPTPMPTGSEQTATASRVTGETDFDDEPLAPGEDPLDQGFDDHRVEDDPFDDEPYEHDPFEQHATELHTAEPEEQQEPRRRGLFGRKRGKQAEEQAPPAARQAPEPVYEDEPYDDEFAPDQHDQPQSQRYEDERYEDDEFAHDEYEDDYAPRTGQPPRAAAQHEPEAYDEPEELKPPTPRGGQQPPVAPPPSLGFDSPPPKRPRFPDLPSQSDPAPDDASVERLRDEREQGSYSHEQATQVHRAVPDEPPVRQPLDEPAAAESAPGERRGYDEHEHDESLDSPELHAADTAASAPDEWADETQLFDVPKHFREQDAPEEQPAEEPADEDVLDQTPEFLQDTPDHDRLWFEQKPPRDFDFDG